MVIDALVVKSRLSFTVSLFCILFLSVPAAVGEEKADLPQYLDRLINEAEKADLKLATETAEIIEGNPAGSCDIILARMKTAGGNEKALAVYFWALGWTHDPRGAEAILETIKSIKSKDLLRKAAEALSRIGGDKAGEYLTGLLDSTSDSDERFAIFNRLACIKYVPALPKMIEILKENWKEYYWHQMFVFGKMGDACVPFLIGKLKDEDRNIRYNAAMVLGEWLAAPEASESFRIMFSAEKDADVRMSFLAGVEYTSTDIGEMKAFFKKVVSESKETGEVKYARESIRRLAAVELSLKMLKSMKKPDAEAFRKTYSGLWKSFGRTGNWRVLLNCSTLDAETELKKLRERILLRDSDEAFYDYRRVNEIIILNRLMGVVTTAPNGKQPPSETQGPTDSKTVAEKMSTPRGAVEFLADALRRKNMADINAVFLKEDRVYLPGNCENIDPPVSFEITAEVGRGEIVRIEAQVETKESKGVRNTRSFLMRKDGTVWFVCDYFKRGERSYHRNPECNEDKDDVKGGGRLRIAENESIIILPVVLHIGASEDMYTAFHGTLLAEALKAKGRFMLLDPVIPDQVSSRMPNNHSLCGNFIWLARSGRWKYPEGDERSRDIKILDGLLDDFKGLIGEFNARMGVNVSPKVRYLSIVHLDKAKMFFGLVDAWNAFGGLWDPIEKRMARAFDVYIPVPEDEKSRIGFVSDLASSLTSLTYEPLRAD